VNIFISWSGERSLQVADALYNWLPRVLHAVKPYLSVEDTAKGAYWASEVKRQLDAADFGIICLTPDNLEAQWIHFESGALSKSLQRASVAPFLFGVTPDALTGPLTLFQATEASKPQDVLRLVKDLDTGCGDRAVGEKLAEDSFGVWWPRLESKLQEITVPAAVGRRPVNEMVREILDRQRTLERLLSDSTGPLALQTMDALLRQAANVPGPGVRAELENTLTALYQALAVCAASDDPAIREVGVHAAAVRAVADKMIRSRPRREPLRTRANAEHRRQTANGGLASPGAFRRPGSVSAVLCHCCAWRSTGMIHINTQCADV
jgi:hypothetical protein